MWCVSVCVYQKVCYINCSPKSAFGWHGWVTGRCLWRAFVSCLECQCAVVWKFVEGACGNVCVFLHVRGQSGTRGTRWICGCCARKRERRSTSTRVTYVWVYPCMCCLEKKYKTQKGFPCNVHLSVSEHPFLLCFQSQWRCLLMLLIINTRKHHIPTLVPWLFCVNSRMSGKIFFWRSKQL